MTRFTHLLCLALSLLVALASTAFAGPYDEAALAEARKMGYTAAQVEAMGYVEVAALAGVRLTKGNSPADFRYEPLRRDVARVLASEENAVTTDTRKAALQAKLREAFATAEVSVRDDGSWEVKGVPTATTVVAAEPVRVAEVEAESGWGTALLALGGAGGVAAGAYAFGKRRAVA